MSEGREDPTGVRKMKKLEKPQGSTNREYLDMDTDEEEFGRQETPEPEEVSEVEPEKPVFTEEEINALVQYVKDFTTLPSLSDADWSREVVELVEEYFRNPANTVLVIYWEVNTLKALLEFPSNIDRGLTYFLRAPWQVYTPNNFLSTVIFGSIDGGVDNSTLKFMENMYAPIALDSDEWPAVVRNELFANLHEFLLCLTDVAYSAMGLTILYVPREGLKDDRHLPQIKNGSKSLEMIETTINKCGNEEQEEEEEKGLLERLERVARYWIKQIREALRGTYSYAVSSPWKTIVDEIRYWHYRYENLCCVYQQLTNASVLSTVEKLVSVQSVSVKQFKPLVAEVQRMLEEAISNMKYLNLLEEFSRGFEIPDEVEDYATRILLLIRFIGTESPYYNTKDTIETLCRGFCVQAAKHCRNFVDLDVVLDGDAEAGRKMLVSCIASCEKLGRTYDRLVDMGNSLDSPAISLPDRSKVFNHVETLVHRCNDLIGIADARIAFDKSDETVKICGPRGSELGFRYRNIEKCFNASLNEIKNARDVILDIVSAAWFDHIAAFRRSLRDIENMVKNWIDDVFEDVLNVEDGIEALHGIARFSQRPYLRETLNNKWIQIWGMFGNDLERCYAEANENSALHHPSLPPFSGRTNILRSNKIYLTRQHKLLIDASDWFGDCDAQAAITRKYTHVLAAISEKEAQLFSEWQNEIVIGKIDPLVMSNQPIIIKNSSSTQAGSITANLQMFCMDHIKEIGQWTLLNCETKASLPKNCPKWETLQSRYNKVDYLCNMYNSTVAIAEDRERFLFSTLLENLEEALSPGFKKITWASDSFEIFFPDCMEMLIKIQESFEFSRSINYKADSLMESIATASLVNADNSVPEASEEREVYLEQKRCHGITMVGRNFKAILKLLLKLRDRIHTDEEQTLEHWKEYLENIYERLRTSVVDCVHSSLLRVLQTLCGDEPHIKIRADSSKVKQAEREIERIKTSAFEAVLPVDEFAKVFDTRGDDGLKIFLNSIDRDDRTIDLRKEINENLITFKSEFQDTMIS